MFTKIERLARSQWLPATLEECWTFFSDPRNLASMTPPSLDLKITSDNLTSIHPGQMITYHVRPLFGLQMSWLTEITHVEKPSLFVDEQRFGPYLFWHHQHHFVERDDGVLNTDIVHYAVGWGPLGILLRPIVRRQLAAIFDYREQAVGRLFPAGERVAPGR